MGKLYRKTKVTDVKRIQYSDSFVLKYRPSHGFRVGIAVRNYSVCMGIRWQI